MQHEYIGHLNPEQLEEERILINEELGHSLQSITLVVGNGACDIGKGRLAASIAGSFEEDTLVIKYDPMLGAFPEDVGVIFDDENLDMDQSREIVSDDFVSYLEAGVDPNLMVNLVQGDLLTQFSEYTQTRPEIRPNEQKKMTNADRANFLAQKIIDIIVEKKPQHVVMEIGGIVEDQEQSHLGQAFRLLGLRTGVMPEIVGLTYLEPSETGEQKIKTQIARNGIRAIRQRYPGLDINSIFVRRRYLSEEVPADRIEEELECIAYETAIDPSHLVFMENVPQGYIHLIQEIVKASEIFD